jgi:hypothetical protein
VLIVAPKASEQLESMPIEVRKAVMAAFRDLRVDPYGTFDSQRSSLRAVYHVAEHPGGLQGLMVLEDSLYRMRYQILTDARGTYAKVLEFSWWEGQRPSQLRPSQLRPSQLAAALPQPHGTHPRQPGAQPSQTKPPHRNEGHYDFVFFCQYDKAGPTNTRGHQGGALHKLGAP